MSKCWQLKALMRKNLILMKRSCCATCCECLFPIILMILLVMVRRAIKLTEFDYTVTDEVYFQLNSTAVITPAEMIENKSGWNGLTLRPVL